LAGADVELVRSGGGVFEIAVDGALAFSKKHLGRFPTDEEVDALAKRGSGNSA
jgi:selT/selW/selH-like putative selenoprotein